MTRKLSTLGAAACLALVTNGPDNPGIRIIQDIRIGAASLREFPTRGYTIVDPPDTKCPWVHWDTSSSKWLPAYDSSGPAWKIFLPIAIDPLMIGKVAAPADSNKVFTFPANAPAGFPAIERLTLAGGFGKIAKSSFNLLGTKVADNADISLELRAKPQS